jgi:MSHA biogenesis protein MshP
MRHEDPVMTPRPPPIRRKRAQGFAIISAIFILVVLAALGAFIVNISSNQQIGSALDVQGVRAYQAAKAGIEWGIYQVQATPAYNFSYGTPPVAVGSANPNTRACPASPASFVPAAPTLSGFTVTVTCVPTPGTSGGPTVYTLTSTACSQPSGGACPNTAPTGFNYIERRIDVSL